MVNPDLDGLEGKWDKDSTVSENDQLKIPTDSRLYAVMVRMLWLGRVVSLFRGLLPIYLSAVPPVGVFFFVVCTAVSLPLLVR